MSSKIILVFAFFICYSVIGGFDFVEVCIENCAQCKKMLGGWFNGPLCAESCIRHRGKTIPDCEDFASIAPFLTKI
ncbi:eclosion hormone-like [Battus philenor]|uniref:eclosion hormone-like n=1 Tax=Battus philenor TaxID=42288 RepID=UPI0035CFF7E2